MSTTSTTLPHTGSDPAPPITGLQVEGLCVDYRTPDGPVRVVSDVGFTLAPGQRLAIVGESGSGKSTLSTALAGLLPRGSADVYATGARLDGAELDLAPGRTIIPVRRPGVSMIFQDAMTSLDPVATIGHQFRAVLTEAEPGLSRRAARDRAAEWVERVGIADPARVLKLRPYELSGGMRQRVMIAVALCGRPRLLIADEPTSALDASVSLAVMELLLELTVQLRTGLVMITHDIELARRYTDTTMVLRGGRVQDLCPTAELDAPHRSPYTQALLRCVPRFSDHDRESLPTLSSLVARAEAAA